MKSNLTLLLESLTEENNLQFQIIWLEEALKDEKLLSILKKLSWEDGHFSNFLEPYLAKRLGPKSTRIFIAYTKKGSPVGMAYVYTKKGSSYYSMNGPNFGIFVSSRMRRKGIGTALVSKVREYYKRDFIVGRADNPKFFAKVGLEEELEEQCALASGGVAGTSLVGGFKTDEFRPAPEVILKEELKTNRILKVICDKELSKASYDTVIDFIKFSNRILKIEILPVIHLHTIKKPEMTTGMYDRNNNAIHALVGKRLIVDVLRTLAHELTHRRQDETGSLDAQLEKQDSLDEMGDINTGYENEAYTLAGNIVKIFCRKYSKVTRDQLYQLQENKKF